jgi:branched-chain amino acid transport system ATP-binding protein
VSAEPGQEAILELDRLSLSFGGLRALSELDLRVADREIVSVIGPNGAGKTTVFNVITGVYAPSAGDVRFAGASIAGQAPHVIARLGIARTFQSLRLFTNMSVLENVMAATYGDTKALAWESILRLPRARREEREVRALAEDVLSSSASGSRDTGGTSPPTPCRTRTGGGWRSPGRWPPGPGCCCSTSRRPG